MKTFWSLLRPHVLQLGSLAGRETLPSASAVSRMLSSVETELVRPVAWWLLLMVSEASEVLRHPAVLHYDAQGRGWHVFDVDPTVTTLYRRALPASHELPEPLRRGEAIAAPGYSGHKRGDLQFCNVAVQHSGSAFWFHAHLSPGNGKGVVDLGLALDGTMEACKRLDISPDSVLFRLDGAFGNVPCISAFMERQLAFITRLNMSSLYQDPELLERMRTAVWYRVVDSGCGPTRSAADLGTFTLSASPDTKHPDGGAYPEVQVRIVASSFPKAGKVKKGKKLDGRQVELFVTTLPAEA